MILKCFLLVYYPAQIENHASEGSKLCKLKQSMTNIQSYAFLLKSTTVSIESQNERRCLWEVITIIIDVFSYSVPFVF